MPTDQSRERVHYLLEVSRAGLGESYLAHLNRAATMERELRERLRALAEEWAWCRFIELVREHGEEIAELFGSPRRRRMR